MLTRLVQTARLDRAADRAQFSSDFVTFESWLSAGVGPTAGAQRPTTAVTVFIDRTPRISL